MAISFIRYINITSGVGGAGAVKSRDLILRVMTTSNLLPPQSYIEFTTLAQVGAYFGTASEEYARASAYFGFISKNASSPDKISFARWVATAQKPIAYGDPTSTATLAALNAITSGKLTVTIGAVTATLTGLNLSGAASLAAVATIVQTALVAVAGLAGSTFVYNSATGNFVLTGPTAGTAAGTIQFASDASETASAALGLLTIGVVISQGSDVETITQTLINSANASTNFASFEFTNGAALTLQNYIDAANWNASNNVDFVFLVGVTPTNAAAMSAALLTIEGTVLTLAPLTIEYPEAIPAKVAASTDYTKKNQAANFMFQPDGSVTPSVTTDTNANLYDPLRVNYMGLTQENGQLIAFYQRGVMCGGPTAPLDIGNYYNEIWLKGDIGIGFLSLLLAVNSVPTNARGMVMCLGVIAASITRGLFNGTISAANAPLTTSQIDFIESIAGTDAKAAQQVQNIGYWINGYFTSSVNTNGVTEYQFNYTLIYAKNNSIRKVNGTHSLI
jgi:hypothetical protein